MVSGGSDDFKPVSPELDHRERLGRVEVTGTYLNP